MQSVVKSSSLHGLLGESARLPDHSAMVAFNTVYSAHVDQARLLIMRSNVIDLKLEQYRLVSWKVSKFRYSVKLE